jgi:hypothetical protein
MSTQTSNSKLGNVIRVSSGNFLEMYDFMVYAYYASYIAREIFPSSNAYASLMMTLGTFGAGYLMRPLGAVILGGYVDRHGRRSGLILTLSLMAVGTLVIAPPRTGRSGLLLLLWCCLGGCCRGFRLESEWVAHLCTFRRWRRPGTADSIARGNRRASRWRSFSRRFWESRSASSCRLSKCPSGAGASHL